MPKTGLGVSTTSPPDELRHYELFNVLPVQIEGRRLGQKKSYF
jgi:hypothetical protein